MTILDQWTIRPAFASVGIVAVLLLGNQIPGLLSLLMIPITLLGIAVGTIALLGVGINHAVKKRPRRAASFLFALIMPVLLWSPIIWIANCVHLGLTVGFGVGQLGPIIKPSGRGLTAYDWSTGLAGQQSTFLVHDETDYVALPTDASTRLRNPDYAFAEECTQPVRHLFGHYYVCTFLP